MPTGKDPVIQYLISLSVVEKSALFSFLLSRGYGEETHEICKYFTGGGDGNEGWEDISFSEKWGVKAKSRLKLALRKFLQEYISYTAPAIEAQVKDAKGCIRLGDFPKAMELLTNCLNHLVKIERFEDLYAVYKLGCEVEEKVAKDAPEMEEWRKARRRYNEISVGMESAFVITRLWDNFMIPFFRRRQRNGEIDLSWIDGHLRELESLRYPFPSTRANISFCHSMSACYIALGDFRGAKFFNGKLLAHFDEKKEVREYFQGMRSKYLLHSLLSNCEMKIRDTAYSDLLKLKEEWDLGDIQGFSRYIIGALTVSEAFGSRQLTIETEIWFEENKEPHWDQQSELDKTRVLFYFLRNKLIQNIPRKIRHYIQQIESFEKGSIKLEIIIYSKIIDILLDWEDGDFVLVKAKTKACKTYLERSKQVENFPQATILLELFSFIRSNTTYPTMLAKIQKTIIELTNIREGKVPEKAYFDLRYYLEEKASTIRAAI